ncbi:MAG: CerR family C-terminal domain-containing protein [Desulfobacteraceae bacterium]|nr:CerR family C-terminal domain-containing protein [Desulfobacteraceae bacterium]
MTDPQDTKKRIIKVATRLFAEKGYDNSSIRAIAREARVNLCAISYHFGGKEGLYQAVLSQNLDEMLTWTDLLEMDNEIEALKIFLIRHFMLIRRRGPEIGVLLSREMAGNGKRLSFVTGRYFKPMLESMENIMARAIKKGVFRRVDPKLAVAGLIAQEIFFARSDTLIKQVLGEDVLDTDFFRQVMDHCFDIFLAGVLKR